MARTLTVVLAAVAISACSRASSAPPTTDSLAPVTAVADSPATGPLELPVRDGPRRQTTGSVPHVQLDAEPVQAVDAELRRRVFLLPGIENRQSDRSLPGARGLAFSDDLELARADVIAGSNEFAHVHTDGSLHVWLAVEAAAEVDRKLWGELHPWVERDGFWDGVVMIYTPETFDELDVAIEIVVEAYNFVTGADLDPVDIP